jgi:vacuolar-type H+-ATPase subunit H
VTPEERRRKALELARETSAKAREFAREVYPTLRRQPQEIAREIGKKAESEVTEERHMRPQSRNSSPVYERSSSETRGRSRN